MAHVRRSGLPRRLIQLYVGLVTFALGEPLIVQALLVVMSWDVLHQGLTNHFGQHRAVVAGFAFPSVPVPVQP